MSLISSVTVSIDLNMTFMLRQESNFAKLWLSQSLKEHRAFFCGFI